MGKQNFHQMSDGRRIAYRFISGSGPAIVFLPGYMSDMAGSKAGAVFSWAQEQGRACLLLDYSGCGLSDGEFAQGTLGHWTEEILALIDAHVAGPVVLIGSSMGGWLMTLAGLALGPRLKGLVGIAAAPDFTRWGYDDGEKARLAAGETVLRPNPYGDEPTPTHPAFWQDAEKRLLLDTPIAIGCPVRLLHGMDDEEVPYAISLQLAGSLTAGDVQITLVKGGDHRLSRPEDIDLLLRTLASLS